MAAVELGKYTRLAHRPLLWLRMWVLVMMPGMSSSWWVLAAAARLAAAQTQDRLALALAES
jgi:hypothetical protein